MENKELKLLDWGLIEYSEAWDKQKELFKNILVAKSNGEKYDNSIIFCEHKNVYTLGKSGKQSNFLISEDFLKEINATLFFIDRGGDITFHGPNQIVCYPIINLQDFNIGIREYIHILEEAVMMVCRDYGVETCRLENATGVWLKKNDGMYEKICAIGVKCSKYVTMHGLAFNINTDLSYFSYINPCGFIDKGVTSLSKELNRDISLDEVKQLLYKYLVELLKTTSL